jgi:hypothetical protein
MHPSQLRQEIAAVFGEIVAAKRLVRAGRAIELEGLDRRIAILCEAVILLPGEESRSLLPLLEDLRSSLDELANALKTASPTDEPLPSP